MTLDDLEKIYGAAYWTRPELEPDGARRAGIVAVVRALRDEMTSVSRLRDVQRLFEEILGSDAGVKVGTHGSPELDEDARKLEAMGQAPGMTLNELLAPATDPAPVCEWRYVAAGNVWLTECEERCNGWTTKMGKTECQFCDGAIKFTETEE